MIEEQAAAATVATAAARGGQGYIELDQLDSRPAPLATTGTSYAGSQFELDVRRANLEANRRSGVYDDGLVADAMAQSLDDNQVLLDQWTRIADRNVVDLIGSVYGGVDMAKGAYRIAINGEHTLDNYVSAGSGLAGAAIGGSIKIGKGLLSPLLKGGDVADSVSFSSFRALKKHLGSPGEGNQWHHIVEQSKISDFGAEAIHTIDNVVALPTDIHKKISGFYSSKQPFTEGQTVRQWLSDKSFEDQYQFGWEQIKRLGK